MVAPLLEVSAFFRLSTGQNRRSRVSGFDRSCSCVRLTGPAGRLHWADDGLVDVSTGADDGVVSRSVTAKPLICIS
jgi:hypothetical protein